MAFDAGLVERLRDAIARAGERTARERGVFSGRGFLLGRSTFVIAWGDGIIVKCAPDEYAQALERPGVTPFAPGGERPMGSWVVVAPDVIADDPELVEWVERALRGVRAVPSQREQQRRKARVRAEASPSTKGAARTSAKPSVKKGATSKPKRQANGRSPVRRTGAR